MLAPGLHAISRNNPQTPLDVDFAPPRTKHFAGATCRQNCKLKRARFDRIVSAQLDHEVTSLEMG